MQKQSYGKPAVPGGLVHPYLIRETYLWKANSDKTSLSDYKLVSHSSDVHLRYNIYHFYDR